MRLFLVLLALSGVAGCSTGASFRNTSDADAAGLSYYLPRTEVILSVNAGDNGTISTQALVLNVADADSELEFSHRMNPVIGNQYRVVVDQGGLLTSAHAQSTGAVAAILDALEQGDDDTRIEVPDSDSVPDSSAARLIAGNNSPTISGWQQAIPAGSLGQRRCPLDRVLSDAGCELALTVVVQPTRHLDSKGAVPGRTCGIQEHACNLDRDPASTDTIDWPIRIRIRADNQSGPQLPGGLTEAAANCADAPTHSRHDRRFLYHRQHIPIQLVLEASTTQDRGGRQERVYRTTSSAPLGANDTGYDSDWRPIGVTTALIANPECPRRLDHRSAILGANATGARFVQGRLVAYGTDQPAFAGTAIAAPFGLINAVLEVPESLFTFGTAPD